MSDPNITPNFIQWLLGIVSLLFFTMLGWVNSKSNTAIRKADASANTVSVCRKEIDKNIHDLSKELMTEVQVKDFVDRSIKPLEKSIQAVHTDIKELLRKAP